MLHELFVRFMGAGIAAAIYFVPVQPDCGGEALQVRALLREPVTQEIGQLVERGYVFAVEYYISIVVNDRKSYRAVQIRRLSYSDGWLVDGEAVPLDSLQQLMGAAVARFERLRFDEGDRLLVFSRARILPDAEFKESTGLQTRILWNYYLPRLKTRYHFRKGRFVADEH
ncbi:MAG: hypothetical protein GKR89_17805 [Candidatus Latescibacteria bacterium]|nr:hypothetical protein [Candidatus Latescibacterota bacterium]